MHTKTEINPLATLAALVICSSAFALAVCGWLCALLTLIAWPVCFVGVVFALFARDMRRHLRHTSMNGGMMPRKELVRDRGVIREIFVHKDCGRPVVNVWNMQLLSCEHCQMLLACSPHNVEWRAVEPLP